MPRDVVRRMRLVAALAVVGAVAVGCAGCTSTATESWTDPSVSSRDSRVLTVMAQGTSTGDGVCSPLVHLEATETDVKVTVKAVTSRPTFSTANCPAALLGPRPFSVTLTHALGSRAVVDAQTGATEDVLDGSRLPTITGLPTRYHQRTLFHDRRGAITRAWWGRASGAYPGVTLTVGPAGSGTQFPSTKEVTVAGRAVSLWSDGDSGQNFAVTWTPHAGERAQIVVSAPSGQWTEAEVLALVPRTDRL